MNRLLLRQLRRLGLSVDDAPQNRQAWQALLERVSAAYEDADRSRYLLERSLHISSQEMAKLNRTVREVADAELARSRQQYVNLLTHSVIPTWQADFSAVGEEIGRLRDQGVQDLDEYLEHESGELDRLAGHVQVVAQNSAATKLLQDAEPELPRDLSIDEKLYRTVRGAIREQLVAIWEGRDHLRVEISGDRSDGTTFHGILHASVPKSGVELDLAQVIVVVTDVTALKEAEARMERLVQSKDEFLASVSHEIRTPLTSVFGSAMELQDHWDILSAQDSRELIGIIAKESGEVADLVEDLLVAARADMGSIRIAPRLFAVRPEVTTLAESLADDESVAIDCGEVHGLVFADPLRFKQILRNLLTNAVRYGGPRARIQSEQVDGVMYISVCDNGNGIAPERRDTIFNLYERDETQPTVTTSVGVGLTVARQLARLMGGDLGYDYVDGWSCFRLTLPGSAGKVPAEPT